MRNVVVTGGSRGIGLAIATTLAAAGYRAIAIARTASEELRCAIAAGDGQGGAVSFRAFDLSASAAIAGQLGITVNAVSPGFVDTQMTRELGEKQREQIVRRSALRRLPGVADVAAGVEFLLSERARNITGITLTVDAGNTV